MNFWYRLFYILAAPFICLFYPFRVSGRENIPEDACVICANHSGLLDPCFAAIAFGIKRHIYFMAKSEFFNNFFLKHVFNAAGVFPVSREETDITAIRIAMKHLKNNDKIMIFPEGSRVSEVNVNAGKEGAVRIASKMKAPVLPVYITTVKKMFRFSKLIIGKPYIIDPPHDKNFAPASVELMEKIYSLEPTN